MDRRLMEAYDCMIMPEGCSSRIEWALLRTRAADGEARSVPEKQDCEKRPNFLESACHFPGTMLSWKRR